MSTNLADFVSFCFNLIVLCITFNSFRNNICILAYTHIFSLTHSHTNITQTCSNDCSVNGYKNVSLTNSNVPLFRFKHIIHGFCVFICPKHANTGIGITGIAVSKCIKLKKKRLSHRQRKNTLTSLHFHTQIYTRQKNACPVMSIYARGLCCDRCYWSVIFFLIDSVGGLRVAWSGVALCKCMEIVPRNATIRNHLFPPPPLHHPGVCNRCSQRQAGGFDVER